ncbi:MAG: Txe/YoeB family addiction module toxin [SAR324 cluster bacterium]|nr:Txe/YoeB family addiction module toxin [SAR324 cluster bacterium]
MRRIVFEPQAFEDFNGWLKQDRQIYNKIISLIQETQRTPFSGLGKPEPLKHELKGFWSRRINQEHRLVYTVTDAEILIASCKYHY